MDIKRPIVFSDTARDFQSPPVGKYDHKSFLDIIDARITSNRELLNSRSAKNALNELLKGPQGCIPGPGECSDRFTHNSEEQEIRQLCKKADYQPMNLQLQFSGTYDVNYAIGRHVANDAEFSLFKSNRVKMRDHKNRDQLAELRKLLGSNDLFTDKRACRRMAHLALYYP
ncbi:hypothetical protein HDU86_001061 [Geranomyces michiganensis]|nr:hypothetical protein HDU86_001061 [Geranomyces michiganensis]